MNQRKSGNVQCIFGVSEGIAVNSFQLPHWLYVLATAELAQV